MYTKEEFMTRFGRIEQMLGRFVSDCDYYLGCGNRCDKHLWAKNPEDHLTYMTWMWEEYKPMWLPKEKLDWYKAEMLKEGK